MPGWKYADKQNGFFIYENEYYVPMGFTYDYYLTRSQYNELSENQRELALLKAIVLEDKDVSKYAGLYQPCLLYTSRTAKEEQMNSWPSSPR